MPTLLLINGQPQRFEASEITIGRSPKNTISLPHDTRLAEVHAILKAVGGRWIVEARDGGPIRVGEGRPTRFAWVNPGDVIHLTDTGPELVLEPEGAAATPATLPGLAATSVPVTAPLPNHRPGNSGVSGFAESGSTGPAKADPAAASRVADYAIAQPPTTPADDADHQAAAAADRRWTFQVVGGGVAVFALIALGIFLGNWGRSASSGSPADSPDVATDPATAAGNSHRTVTPGGRGTSGGTVTPGGTVASAGTGGTDRPVATDPQLSVYRLELQSSDGARRVQLGTAWAVGTRRLVTTGDAARGIALNQEFYPKAQVRHSTAQSGFVITGIALHPEYEQAANRLDDAVRRIEEQQAALGQAESEADKQQIIAELRQLDDAAIVAADEAVNVNFAVLEVDRDLPVRLGWTAVGREAKVGQRLVLVGHPLSPKDPLVDPDHPVLPVQRVGRLKFTPALDPGAAPTRWLVGFDESLTGQNWSGSPLLDAQGVVVAVYSRPTPPLAGKKAGAIETHDVTVVSGLKALLPAE